MERMSSARVIEMAKVQVARHEITHHPYSPKEKDKIKEDSKREFLDQLGDYIDAKLELAEYPEASSCQARIHIEYDALRRALDAIL